MKPNVWFQFRGSERCPNRKWQKKRNKRKWPIQWPSHGLNDTTKHLKKSGPNCQISLALLSPQLPSLSLDHPFTVYLKKKKKHLKTIRIIHRDKFLNATADWLLILVHFIKYLRHGDEKDNGTMSALNDTESLHSKDNDNDGLFSLEDYKLQGLPYYIFPALIVSYVTYLGVGGFLHWYYYVRQRDRPEEWKCQPTKWLSPELERHEILLGSLSLFFGSILSGIISCYIMNGGDTYVYYDYSQYGYIWAVLQWPVIFMWQVNQVSRLQLFFFFHLTNN